MRELRQAQRHYCSRAMFVAIAIGFGLLVFGEKAACRGLVLGTLLSNVNFVLIAQTLPAKLGRSKRGAFAVSLASLLLRYGLMAVPVVVALRSEQFLLPAAVAGLFMVQGVILAERAFFQLTHRKTQGVQDNG